MITTSCIQNKHLICVLFSICCGNSKGLHGQDVTGGQDSWSQARDLFGGFGVVVHELGPPAHHLRAAFFDGITATLAHPPQPVVTRPAVPPPQVSMHSVARCIGLQRLCIWPRFLEMHSAKPVHAKHALSSDLHQSAHA